MQTLTPRQHAQALDALAVHESNARTYARTFDRMFAKGLLARVWDVEGREYLDCLACAGALPLGHNHPYVMERVQDFLASGHVLQGLDLPTVARHAFVEQLMQTLPADFARQARLQFCGPTGSDAVEAALKLFKTATGRRSVIAFHGAYHGMTMGALSLMGNLGPKQALSGFTPETHFFPYPHDGRCPFGVGGALGETLTLNYLENALSDPESGITPPAMVILEAVQGEGGCIPAPVAWLQRLREITQAHGIPLVIDEVQTGFGRTGTLFAFEAAGITPDAVVMSKALGGGFPLAVLAYHERHDQWAPGAHAGTFRGNQIALVAGAATMQFIREQGLATQARVRGGQLQDRLRALARDFPCLGEVRGRGLMVGVEVVRPGPSGPGGVHANLDGALARRIKRECFERGLILETGGRHGAVLRLLPPLVITEAEVDLAVDRLGQAIGAALSASPHPLQEAQAA
jgi:diaminobutyrate-2-oxoglutarate transaminase